MTEPMVAVGMLLVLILAIFLGFPVAFTLMALGVGVGYYAYYDAGRMWAAYNRAVEAGADGWTLAETWIGGFFNNRIFDLFVNQTYSTMSNDVLTSIPLFLFMGYIVERANVIDRLFSALYIASRRIPGSMAVAALITCTLFATASGIVGAVVTLMGLLALPSMLKARYDVRYATGVICAGGTLGILIPPSILLIVYAATSGVSVVRMYAAAMIPGFLLAGLYLLYVVSRAVLKPEIAPRPSKEDVGDHTFLQICWMMLVSFVPMAVLILSVLASILFGLATPSEAAAVGAAGGLVLAAAYGGLTWERLKESVYLTARASAMVCWLFVGSATFASIFAYLGGQQLVSDFVTGLDMSPLMFLIVAQIIIFILGWPLEWTEIIVIFIPIFLPLLPHFGIDPLFFGMLVAVNLQTAFLSPPMAMSAYYLKGVAPPQVQLTDIFRGMMPYMAIVILCMVVMYVFPQTVFWLPNLVYGR
ncbi:TRAP transporter large permease [Kumtagia ephedrae]|jgi:tripartite ATP-independent transporter DctM subunit|uniref:TRAP transporter large permease protein n=1 Tax=Kumtagia ephedrae TaxID=2116701 RepID=A0A2P7RSG9_9HYPH|nr:TRAP transporter large permease subunit [Mesorhizobium ephedrae]PSJ53164.1 C4-dicarboxylate ABC transporter [Mesorhizobium ephedrae]